MWCGVLLAVAAESSCFARSLSVFIHSAHTIRTSSALRRSRANRTIACTAVSRQGTLLLGWGGRVTTRGRERWWRRGTALRDLQPLARTWAHLDAAAPLLGPPTLLLGRSMEGVHSVERRSGEEGSPHD